MEKVRVDIYPNSIIDIAPRFVERLKNPHVPKCLEKKYRYDLKLGDYSSTSILAKYGLPEGESIDQLVNMEAYLQDTINDLLTKQKGATPIVIMDIGGGGGLTWLRLAKSFQENIETGTLAFVVTNLYYPTGRETDNPFESRLSEAEKQFYEQTRNLVHFVKGTINEVRNNQVNLPNGTLVSLSENVALLHERASLTAHSNIPEHDIVQAASMLSEHGMYFIHKVLTPWGIDEISLEDPRDYGIALAREHITNKFGLIEVDRVEEGRNKNSRLAYSVFRKPNSPAIRVS